MSIINEVPFYRETLANSGGLTEQRVATPHRVVYIIVPLGVVASVRFEARSRAAWPLQGGVNRFEFPHAPPGAWVTAAAGPDIEVCSCQPGAPEYELRATAGMNFTSAGETVGPSAIVRRPDGLAALQATNRYAWDPNASTNRRMTGNYPIVLLAQAARAATTASPNQLNVNARGVLLIVNVSVNPGGGQTLQLRVGRAGTTQHIIAQGVAWYGAGFVGSVALIVYPGVDAVNLPANTDVRAVPLPQNWFASVVHSGAGSWTYSLTAEVIL